MSLSRARRQPVCHHLRAVAEDACRGDREPVRGLVPHVGISGLLQSLGSETFITGAARKISTVGGSLRDVQMLAGHAALSTTQRYIEADVEVQRKVVDLI